MYTNISSDLLNSTYTSNCEDGTEELRGRSEVDQRRKYFAKLDDEQYHPLRVLMYKCLDNNPAKRPPASDVVCEVNEIMLLWNPQTRSIFLMMARTTDSYI